MFASTLAQLLENLAGALDVDLVRHFDRSTEVGPFSALRTSHRIERHIRRAAEPAGHLAEHLLRHLLRALAKLLQRPLLGLRGTVEITSPQRFLGLAHRILGAAELRGRLDAVLLHALAELTETIAQITLAAAQRARSLTRLLAALALLTALALAALSLPLPALAALLALSLATLLALLALLTILAFAIFAALLFAEGVIEELLLLTDQIAELIHHLHHLLVLLALQSDRMNIVKAAVGFVLAGDRLAVSRLRSKFSEPMAKTAEWSMFP